MIESQTQSAGLKFSTPKLNINQRTRKNEFQVGETGDKIDKVWAVLEHERVKTDELPLPHAHAHTRTKYVPGVPPWKWGSL